MRIQTNIGQKTALLVAFVLGLGLLLPGNISAAGMTNTYVRLDRMKAATQSSVRVVFTTSTATATEDTVKLDFNGTDTTTWTGSSGVVNAAQTVTTATCATETGKTALPGTLVVSGASPVVTITGVTNLAPSTGYCFDLTSTSAVTLPIAGEYHAVLTTQTGATVDDKAVVALRVVAEDQITVTANVPPTFNFQLDSNTTAFTADLSPGTKRTTTPRTFTVNTNAKTGWVAWIRNADANGLYSTGVAKNIAPTTPGTAVDVDTAASTEQYVWGVTGMSQVAGLGTMAVSTAFDATGGTFEGTGVDNSYRQVASSSGTSDTSVVTLAAAATIAGITPAASDYTDVVQVIGAGQF
ncbi:MAG TPA: hypothetical protein VF575_02955 [Candidatus Saccharimonadales bacterium]|jgi:hypothetical protein